MLEYIKELHSNDIGFHTMRSTVDLVEIEGELKPIVAKSFAIDVIDNNILLSDIVTTIEDYCRSLNHSSIYWYKIITSLHFNKIAIRFATV